MSDFYPTITAEANLKQAPTNPHPPTKTPDKIDIILSLMDEVERLKQIREDVVTGQRQADNILKAEMYITQLGLSAYKIILDGLKEAAKIQINTQNNIEANVKVDVKPMLAEYEQLIAESAGVKAKSVSANSLTQQVHPAQANGQTSPVLTVRQ